MVMNHVRLAAFHVALLTSVAVPGCTRQTGDDGADVAGEGKADCAQCNKLHSEDRLRVATEREDSRWGDTLQSISEGVKEKI